MLPLIRCRECDSKLLQLERIWLLADGRRVAHRRCPECGTRDSVTVGAFAMKLWLAREERLRSELSADRVRAGRRCRSARHAHVAPTTGVSGELAWDGCGRVTPARTSR